MYPTQTGHWTNGRRPLTDEQPRLGQLFSDAGYETAYIGKWHLGEGAVNGPVAKDYRGGYQFWLASNALEMTSDDLHTTVYDANNKPVYLPGYRADALVDAAIRYLSTTVVSPEPVSFSVSAEPQVRYSGTEPDKPFFLFLSLVEPHHQNHVDTYPAPEGYRERYEGRWTPPDLAALVGSAPKHLAGYWGMVKRIDEAFGRLLEALRSLQLDKNTVVLFTSDHGCHFKTRNSEYKRSCHEASIRVPGVIAGPGFRQGGKVDRLTSIIDLPPTLLDVAGIDIPSEMQGHSFLPLIRDPEAEWRDEVLVQISEEQVGRALRTPRWKYSVSAPERNAWNDASAMVYQEEFLYDLASDPYELNNLIGFDSHSAVTESLRSRLLERIAESGEESPEILPAAAKSSGQYKVFVDEI
jgi:arylsulfatase A-like enzyme